MTPRWVAVFGLQWPVIESHRLESGAALSTAMTAAASALAETGGRSKRHRVSIATLLLCLIQNVQNQPLLTSQPVADIRYSVAVLTLAAAVRKASEFRFHGFLQAPADWECEAGYLGKWWARPPSN
jgi:hypothetical protein